MFAAPGKPLPVVLLIENDESDVFLFRRALGKLEWHGELRIAASVSEARAYMQNLFPFQDKNYYRRPELIVTDYKLNSQTAMDFVRWIRGEPMFDEIPVVVLTGVRSEISAEQLSEMKVAGFLVKSPDVEKLAGMIKPYLP